jgi:hypothetical protein
MTNQIIELITLLTAGLTAGSAIYISLVIHPAWLKTSTQSAVENFAPVFNGSFVSQAFFSMIAILGGIVLGLLTEQYLWIVGSVIMIINIPLTKISLMPINNILLGKKDEFSDSKAIELFKKWGNLQWIRTSVVIIPFVLFLWLAVFE